MIPADLRPQLQAIAAGKHRAAPSAAEVDGEFAQRHQRAFRAWLRFADPDRSGEPLTAPAEILTPLP